MEGERVAESQCGDAEFSSGNKGAAGDVLSQEREAIHNSAPQKLSSTSYAAQLALKKADTGKKIARLKGVLVVNQGDAYSIEVPVK